MTIYVYKSATGKSQSLHDNLTQKINHATSKQKFSGCWLITLGRGEADVLCNRWSRGYKIFFKCN